MQDAGLRTRAWLRRGVSGRAVLAAASAVANPTGLQNIHFPYSWATVRGRVHRPDEKSHP